MAIIVRVISYEYNKYFPQDFLDEYKCYIMIELTILKKLMLIKQMPQKSVMFVTTGIF